MWPLDNLTKLNNNVQSSLTKAISEGFGPAAYIANTIGSTIGSITGGISESKKLAEQQAVIDAQANIKKETATVTTQKEIAIQDISNVSITFENNPTAYILNITKIVFTYFFAFIFAMLVVNQNIFEHVVYKILIFIVIIFIPFIFSSIALIPLGVYYIGLILWRVYLRSTPEYKDKKLSLLPKIYCMLPLTTVEGTNSFIRFFKYPFYYPKSENGEKRLQKEQIEYMDDLKSSFYKWDEMVKKYPEFNTKLNELNEQFKKLITPIYAPVPEEVAYSAPEEAEK